MLEVDLVGERAAAPKIGMRAAATVIRFHGSLPSARTAERYARADALTLVSLYEPFGVAPPEGVAAGCR